MRIAIDSRCIQEKMHGIARYTLNLIRNIEPTSTDTYYIFYHPLHLKPWAAKHLRWIPVFEQPLSLAEQWILPALLKKYKIDMVHFPSFVRPIFVPCSWTMTLHDLIHIETQGSYGKKQAWYYAWLKKQIPKAKQVLTVSETSKQAILKWGNLPSNKVFVTPLAGSLQGSGQCVSAKDKPPFLLFVGNAKPHKQFQVLYDAFVSLVLPYQLKVVGFQGERHDRIHYTGPLSDDELASLYQSASALILPSSHEGFGLPLIEAMALKTPVIASDISVFHEIAKDTVTYFEVGSVAGLKQVLTEFDLPEQVKERERKLQEAFVLAGEFSWEKMAHQIQKAYVHCV